METKIMKFKGYVCPQCGMLYEADNPNVADESVLRGTVRKCPDDGRELRATTYTVTESGTFPTSNPYPDLPMPNWVKRLIKE